MPVSRWWGFEGGRDVRECCALECDSLFETLGEEPGEVDGCVDADCCKGCGACDAFWKFVLGEGAILGCFSRVYFLALLVVECMVVLSWI